MYEMVTHEPNINTLMFVGEGKSSQGTMIGCNNILTHYTVSTSACSLAF